MELEHAEEFLAHYGVLGMKWGVRKERERTGRRRGRAQDDTASRKDALRNSYRSKQAAGQELTPEEKQLFDEDAKKFAKVVGTGLLVGAGLVAVRMIGAKRASRIPKMLPMATNALGKATNSAKKVDPTQRIQEWWQGYADRSVDIFDAIPKEAINRMSTTALEIPAGQTIKRMSTNTEDKIRDAVYASFKEDDWNRYKAVLPVFWESQQGKSEGYQITYKAAKTLRAPSEREQFKLFSEEFAKLRKEQPDAFEDLMENYDMRAFFGGQGKITALRDRAKAGMSDEELARRAYDAFAQDLNNPQSPLTKRFVERVRKEGYNMIVDDNDRGRLSDMPVIILDGQDNLIREGMEKVGLVEINAARSLLKDVTGARVPKK